MKKLKFYLAGPIQFTDDFMNWREDIRDFLEELGHEALLPWGEIFHGKKGKAVFNEWTEEMSSVEYLRRVSKYMRTYVMKWDLKAVIKSDGVICYLPKGVPTSGSHGELTLIYYLLHHKKRKKNRSPRIFVVTDEKLEDLFYWVIGCSDRVFFDWKSFKKYFKEHFSNKQRKVKNNG